MQMFGKIGCAVEGMGKCKFNAKNTLTYIFKIIIVKEIAALLFFRGPLRYGS
jgi:hypothetical protein